MKTNVMINSDCCWICGAQSGADVKITNHHAIPRTFKPVCNVIIPICETCHEEINKQDIGSMFQFSYKIQKETENLLGQVNKLNSYLENNFKIKVKQ